MDELQIVIFVLTLLYFIFSGVLKKKKRAEDFEWEGDGTLDDIIQQTQQSEQSGGHETTWTPWLEESASADDDLADDFSQQNSDSFEDEFVEADSFEEHFEPMSNEQREDEFEETFSSAVPTKNTDPQLEARIEKKIQEALHAQTSVFKGDIFSSPAQDSEMPSNATTEVKQNAPTNMANKRELNKGVHLDSLLSKYSSAQLLVVLPTIMNRKDQ